MELFVKENVIKVDLAKPHKHFQSHYIGCVVLTQDNQILLQQRPDYFSSYPGYLCEFGGKIEQGEEAEDALVREMKEELGAHVDLKDVTRFGAITELMSKHSELIHTFFWHDKLGSITGCYEGEPRYFNNAADILASPKLTDGLRWLVGQCKSQGLIK
jgi:8-oxo-dGTP diphosphatase